MFVHFANGKNISIYRNSFDQVNYVVCTNLYDDLYCDYHQSLLFVYFANYKYQETLLEVIFQVRVGVLPPISRYRETS